jgi:hypothetical protein
MKIFIQATMGLYQMHFFEFFHRDLKPENVLLSSSFDAKIGKDHLFFAMSSFFSFCCGFLFR